jgi:ferritin-like metal-binding protein YciE
MAKIESPRELFLSNLGSALKMENEILEMLENLEDEAHDPELKQNLSHHHQETQQQLRNLERAFQVMGEEPKEQTCAPIEGIEKEGKQSLKQVDDPLVDQVILGGAAKTEHHEIAVYNGLIMKAEALGESEVVDLLRQNLEQEEHTLKEVDQKARRLIRPTVHAGAR